jgi:DNA-binding transcriptional ArsR family regulator
MENIPTGPLDPKQMAAAAGDASELLKSLANPHRLLILCQLTEGERSVGDLATFLNLRDSTVSQHLSLLRRDGLVRARRDGQTIWYSVSSQNARLVLGTLFEIFCKPVPISDTPATAADAPASKPGTARRADRHEARANGHPPDAGGIVCSANFQQNRSRSCKPDPISGK